MRSTEKVAKFGSLAGLLLCAGLVFFAAAPHVLSQAAHGGGERAEPADLGPWKLVNTGIFAVALGWFLVKYSPRFFNARSSDIQKAIQDATGLKIQADFRSSEIDRKMATLDDAVRHMRDQAKVEMEREHERIRRDTEEQISHMRDNASNEVEGLRKEGQIRVKIHVAELALDLAERRLRDRFSRGEPGQLTDDFIHLVEQGKN